MAWAQVGSITRHGAFDGDETPAFGCAAPDAAETGAMLTTVATARASTAPDQVPNRTVKRMAATPVTPRRSAYGRRHGIPRASRYTGDPQTRRTGDGLGLGLVEELIAKAGVLGVAGRPIGTYGGVDGSTPQGGNMGIFQRAHDIVQAKTNKALDAAEKPDEMLDLSYEKMLEQITQVRRALVDLAASKKRLELQEEQFQHTIDHLQEQAKQALEANREDLAKEALSRKAAAQQQIDQMEPQRQQLEEEEQKLTKTLDALQKRVNDFRTQKETLKAQYTAAKAVSEVDESTAGISKSFNDSGASLQRAQDKIATMQARSGALDELLESGVLEDVGGGTDDIQKELDQVGKDAQVDQELAALKAQIGTGAPEPEALAAAPAPAPEESTPAS